MTAPANSLWFMTSHLLIHMAQADNADGISMIEHRMAKDFAPPLHIHHAEDETFFILEGTFRFQRDGETFEAGVGDSVYLPTGSKHGFRVLSDYGRCLTVTTGPFEAMVRAASRVATTDTLPEQLPPTAELQLQLARICAAHSIDLIGPPII